MDVRIRFVILLFMLLFGHISSHIVTLKDNGYSGIVVAIDEDVDEMHGDKIIHNLEEMFTRASEYLYEATWHRAYFREVTILLPEKWNRTHEVEIAGRETYNTAHLRVTHPNPSYYSKSHTVQPSQACQQEGLYVHLNEDHLLNINSPEMIAIYGPADRWLTRYWSHYRYGIFDEHGYPYDSKYPPMFGENAEPNVCVKDRLSIFFGEYVNITTGKECAGSKPEVRESLVCVFYPDPDFSDTSTSITFNQSLTKITHFCDENSHDINSPNRQNEYCERRSTWSVISQHPDFLRKNQPREIKDTKPSFHIVSPSDELKIVLLFDVSASTNGEVLQTFRQAATRFITNTVPLGSVMGSIAFNKCAFMIKNMTKLLTPGSQTGLVPSAGVQAECNTCIGCGILTALDLLQQNGNTEGAKLILLTDGNESARPRIIDVLPDVIKAGVRVFPIAYGNLADQNLELLAQVSNGKTFFIPKRSDFTALAVAVAMDAVLEARQQYVTKVMDKGYSGRSGYDLQGSFILDKPSPSYLSFATMFDLHGSLQHLVVKGPHQLALQPAPKASMRNNVFSLAIKNPKAGIWHYQLRLSSLKQNVGISVSTQQDASDDLTDVEQINVEGWINVNAQKITAKNTPVALFAQVQQKGKPVLNVHVVASILLPNGQVKQFQLLDNGAEPDLQAKDGLYSRYFIDFVGKGRYGVKFDVSNHHTNVYNNFKTSKHTVGLVLESRLENKQQDILKLMRIFQRSIGVGSFTVVDDVNINRDDVIPPNTIRDLKITHSTADLSHISLEWTAPGDDYDRGTATSYEVKYSDDPLLLINDSFPKNSNSLTSNEIETGSLTPLPSGTKQEVTLRLPEVDETFVRSYYLSIRAVDDVGNAAKPSNLVQIFDPTLLENCVTENILLPHPKVCKWYLKCEAVGKRPKSLRCQQGKVFNVDSNACEKANSVHCNIS